MPSRLLTCLVLCSFASILSGCGFLDQDVFLNDEQFAQTLELEGMMIRGHGGFSSRGYGSSCGGGVHGLGLAGYRGYSARATGEAVLPVVAAAQMTDEQLLEQTDVEMVDETPVASAPPGTVRYVYEQHKAARDEAILQYAAGTGE